MNTTVIFDPTAPGAGISTPLRRLSDGLNGKVVGFIDDSKPNFEHLVDDLAALLVGGYGVARVIKRRKLSSSQAASEAVLAELADQCDAVITGSGD